MEPPPRIDAAIATGQRHDIAVVTRKIPGWRGST